MAMVGILLVGCTDSSPTTAVNSRDLSASLSRGSSDKDHEDGDRDDDDRGARARFNTKMRAEFEIPTSTSISTGFARIRVPNTGPIRSRIDVDNKGNEVIRFCHIHWIDPANTGAAAGTGPVVWFLTPTGINLQLMSTFFIVGQDADYVTNTAFGPDDPANEATARAALLADPSKFYVNCHSNAFPAGFMRGRLPGDNGHHH